MAEEKEKVQENVQYEQLGKAGLSFVDVIAQSFGFMGPVFGAILLLITVVGANNAGKGAGLATPLAIIVAAIGVGALGWLIAQYAKRIHAAGALYDYISAGFGERVGFVFGWIYQGGLLVLAAAIPLLIGGVAQDWLHSHNWNIPYWVLSFVYLVILFCVLYFGVRISTRVQLGLVLVSASVVTIFLIYVIFKSGSNSTQPFNPSSAHGVGNFFYGVLYAILLFVGFESAANLAEETKEPKRNIPRAVLWSVGIVTLYFVIASYSQAVGFHLDVKAWATSGAPVLVLALPKSQGGYGSQFLYDLMNVLLILDIAAVGIGASVACTRLTFSLSRDRRIPGVFAGVSRRYGTPVVAIWALMVITIIEVGAVRLSHGLIALNGLPEYFAFFLWLAQYGSLSLAVIYAALALASIRGLSGQVNTGALAIAVIIALVITGLAIFSAVYHVPSPLNTVTTYFLIWAAIGVVILLVLILQGNFRLSAQGAGAITAGQEEAGHLETGVAHPGPEVRGEF
jgi:amino acid transporter